MRKRETAAGGRIPTTRLTRQTIRFGPSDPDISHGRVHLLLLRLLLQRDPEPAGGLSRAGKYGARRNSEIGRIAVAPSRSGEIAPRLPAADHVGNGDSMEA